MLIGFGGLKFLVIESELTIECVIWFGRIGRIFKGSMETVERDHCFQCLEQ
jgi:hypothetical protein